MNTPNRKRNWIFFISALVMVSSACNLIKSLNPANQVINEIEDLATQIPMDEIQEGIEALSTDLPEGIGDIGDLLNIGNLGDLEATAQALADQYEPSEIPPDIPVVEGPKENLFSSKGAVTYGTLLPFDKVVNFYKTEMPKNEWIPKGEGDVFADNVMIINFTKPNRDAIVTLSHENNTNLTIVLISIQPK